MTKTFTAEEIRRAIEEDGLRGVLHLIGPSPEEEQRALDLNKYLDRIEDRCDWNNPCPDLKAQEARALWQGIMRRLSEYEAKYF